MPPALPRHFTEANYYDTSLPPPSRLRRRFPGAAGDTTYLAPPVPISFEHGTRTGYFCHGSCFQASRLVAVQVGYHRASDLPRQSACDISYDAIFSLRLISSPQALGILKCRKFFDRGHLWVHFRYGPVTRILCLTIPRINATHGVNQLHPQPAFPSQIGCDFSSYGY